MNPALYDQTVRVAMDSGVLTAVPDETAVRTDLALQALQGLDGDTTGANFSKISVQLQPGGE